MKDAATKKASATESSLVTHAIAPEDAAVMTAMCAAVLSFKGQLQGIAAREPFKEILEHVSPPEGIAFRADTVGGISGFWCKPSNARSGDAILHLHGGCSTGDRRRRTAIWWATSPHGQEPRHSCPITGSPLNIPSPPL